MSPPSKKRPGRPELNRPTVFIPKARKGRRSKIFYFTYKGVNESTGCTDRRDASRVAANRAREIDDERAGIVRAEGITVAGVLDFHLEWIARHYPERLVLVRAWVKNLRPFWGAKLVADIAPQADGRAYEQSYDSDPSSDTFRSSNSIRADLGELNSALRIYAEEHADLGFPRVVVFRPGKSPPRSIWLSRDEVARILRHMRGRIWDAQANDWARLPPLLEGEPGRLRMRSPQWRERHRFMLRLILLAVYSGSRSGVLLNLRWEAGPDHGHVDPITGDLERRGWAEPVSPNKLRTTARLPGQASVLAALWAKNDLDGFDIYTGRTGSRIPYVIHHGGLPVEKHHYSRRWIKACSALGFSDKVVFYVLKHTTATWLIEGGATIKEAAAFLGIDVRTFTSTYLEVSPHFAQDAALAMDPRRYNPKRDKNLFGEDDIEPSRDRGPRPRPRGPTDGPDR